jgi:CBS domain-containing protein
VRVIHPQATMAEAAHLMIKERISGLPVVDDDLADLFMTPSSQEMESPVNPGRFTLWPLPAS